VSVQQNITTVSMIVLLNGFKIHMQKNIRLTKALINMDMINLISFT